MRITKTEIGIVLTLAGASLAEAAVVRVPGDEATIQAGIDAAAEGDTVLVAPGEYRGTGNHNIDFSASTAPDTHNVVLLSEGGAAVTIIDVEGGPEALRRGFVFARAETSASVVDGFTVRNGYMSDPMPDPKAREPRHELSGGGMVFRNSAAPIIRNCVIESCTSFYSGGGLEAELFSSPTIEGCVLRGNVSEDRGGGMSIERFSNVTLIDCVFTGNVAAVSGGGLQIEEDSSVIGCTVAGNRAGRGGGIYVKFPGNVTMTRSIVYRNSASGNGDDVYVQNDGVLEATCAVIDTTAVEVIGTFTFEGVSVDPLFCAPESAGAAPTIGGTYSLAANSPALEAASPCALQVGAYGATCGAVTPVRPGGWRSLKDRFR